MFKNNCSKISISSNSSFICVKSQSSSRPTNTSANNYQLFGTSNELNTLSDETRNKRYKEKCTRLQKQIRHLVFINNAIHSELNLCLNKLSKASDERRFLLNKILRFHKDMNQETISSRILQEALSKKQSSKQSSLSPSSQTTSQSQPVLCSSQSLTQTAVTCLSEGEGFTSQSSHSSQLNSQSCPKTPMDRKTGVQSNDWTKISQTIGTESQSSVGSNKRIKLSDCQTSVKK